MTGSTINSSRPSGELLERQLPLIEALLRQLSRRKRLRADESEDFYSHAMLRLLVDDCRILRSFSGRSSLKTYLTVVLHRLFLDYRIKKWGKWRPSAAARRLGPVAVELDRLINRDMMSQLEAVELLCRRDGSSRSDLEALAGRFPTRCRPRSAGEASLSQLAGPQSADRQALDIDRADLAEKIRIALNTAMSQLKPEDRIILTLRFEGNTIVAIANRLGIGVRHLYTRIDRCLKMLRQSLEARGIDRNMAASIAELNDAWTRRRDRLSTSCDV